MDEPVDEDSVWPHTEMVLFMMGSDQCFGEPLEDVISEVMNSEHILDEGYHVDNELSASPRTLAASGLEKDREIIPNSLILVHCDLMIDTKMTDYLNGTTIPKSSRIVAVVDDPAHSAPKKEIDKIRRPIEIALSKEDIMHHAKYYFQTICPECSGEAARSWVFNWKQGVFHRVHN